MPGCLWSCRERASNTHERNACCQGNTISAIGATKRASLEVGRQRTDLLFSLDPAKIKGLLSAYDAPGVSSAMDDRKVICRLLDLPSVEKGRCALLWLTSVPYL